MAEIISAMDGRTFLVCLISLYLLIPPGIPFLTPAGSFINQIRAVNFTIAVHVAIFLYLQSFTLLESLFVATFWTSFLAYILMV